MIKFQNVSVEIKGKRILNNINLTVNDGEFVLLCGESGCGKTTLTRLVNGMIPHFIKDVKVDGTVDVYKRQAIYRALPSDKGFTA